MSKRRPGKELNHDNWDAEEEEEEAGTFTSASRDTLKGRQIKKAKRRGVTNSNTEEGNGASAFKAFTGFGGFGAATGGIKPTFAFNVGGDKKLGDTSTAPSQTNGDKGETKSDAKTDASKDRSAYLSQLKSLNESVLKWIQTHVQKNPYCILTPIFKDYGTHLDKVEKLDPTRNGNEEKPKSENGASVETKAKEDTKEDKKTPVSSTETKTEESKPAATFGGFSFSTASAANSSSTSTAATGGFTFGLASGSTGTGIFGSKPSDGAATSTSGFSFGDASKPVAESSTSGASNKEDDEYVPPKAEVKTITEDDAFYSKRCKLFFKKGESWQDKGVGNLHLKPCDGKTQLLIRADTNLGNILLNIIINKATPATRSGKNNVMIVCVPNPPLDEKKPDDKTAVSMLVRVKTGEDADELLAKIDEVKTADS